MSRLETERGEGYMLPVGIEYSLRISSGRTLDTRQRSRRYLSNKSIIQQLANVCVKDRKQKRCKGLRIEEISVGWVAGSIWPGCQLILTSPYATNRRGERNHRER